MSFTLLLVEDERPLSEAIRLKLEHEGISVFVARSVSEAKTILREEAEINAIWLDHYLIGKEDGLDLVAYLKSEKSKFKHIPVFVVTNSASEDKLHTYLELGIEKYFAKTEFRLDQIVENIKKSLSHHPADK